MKSMKHGVYGWLTMLVEQHHWPVGKRDGEVILYYFDSLFLSFDEGMVAPCSPHPCFAVWGTTQAPCDLPFLSFSKESRILRFTRLTLGGSCLCPRLVHPTINSERIKGREAYSD